MGRTGILGGTFDPIHLGHLITAQYAFNHLTLDRVLLVPSAAPVHRPRHMPADAEHRLRMCRLAAASIPGFEVSDVEVSRAEPSYTVLTLRYLKASMDPAEEIVLLVGEDNLPTIHTWHRFGEILSIAALAILPRPSCEPVKLGPLRATLGPARAAALLASRIPCPLVPVSATEIRERVREGKPISGLVPGSVAAYISAANLYRDAPRG